MRTYSVTQTITTSSTRVWKVLTHLDQYGEWAPGTDSIEGQAMAGNWITVHHPSGKKTVLQISELIPEQKMVLKGGLAFNLLTGERTYTLTAQSPNTTLFTMTEVFKGLLMPIIGRIIPDMTEGFEAFANALKTRSEAERQD